MAATASNPADEDHNFISCLTWVPRGFAKENPVRLRLNDGDDENETGSDDDDDRALEEVPKNEPVEDDEDDVVKKYGLDDYDDDDGNPTDAFSSIAAFQSNAADPYVTLKDEDESDDDDAILPTDNLAVAGHVNGESFSAEVNLFNADEDHSFVHHDFLLPSLPLCLEWIGFDPGEDTVGNLLAVGSMTNVIDVWDLDLMEPLEPAFRLGNKPMGKKKKKKKSESNVFGHSDAVLALAWNRNQRHVLASGSADFTVELWDLSEGRPGETVRLFEEKVQTLAWHPLEAHNLLAGGCDRTVRLMDCRDPTDCHKKWIVDGEVEKVLFDKYSPLHFFVATDKGMVYRLDARTDKPLFTLAAHDDAVTSLSQSPTVPYCLVTSSMDKSLKLWDFANERPECVVTKNFKIGPIHCAEFCPDAGLVVALGGNKGCFKIWDAGKSAAVKSRFAGRVAPKEEKAVEETE